MSELPPGHPRVIGKYEILSILGKGGMGIVYKARQTNLNRVVTLKMVQHWQDASSDTMARFSLEAEAAAKLDHQNIVPTYEIGEIDGQPYFSMKGTHLFKFYPFRLISEPQHIALDYAT